MERNPMTGRSRQHLGSAALKAFLLAGASLSLLAAAPAQAQVAADERVYRADALAHAGAVETAWRRLETFILEESAGPAGWPGVLPPASTGWNASWTARGVEARYCEDTLLVYLAPERLKGTGPDHRAVHAAPHAYGDERAPALHWLENGRAEGGAGRAGVALPACLSESGGPLPSGRAALAGTVRDPWMHTRERLTRERRHDPCGDGEHGEGRTLIREVRREHNGRDEPVGDPVEGPWEVSVDLCRADYSRWEHYTLACHWDAGAPHNRRMEGREVWRRLRTVTADGETLGPPEFVSTSCWTGGALPPPPTPEIDETAREETKSEGCPAGYTGSIGYRRTVTLRSTRFPWDAAPVTQTITGAWTVARDDCVAVPEPDWSDDGGGYDGGGPGGTAGPGGDACGGDPDGSSAGAGTCSADGSGGGGSGGGGDGGCFLTTAVTESRGEADGGPALTALRAFRDGYMTRTAGRRALVVEYYAIAPRIVAAIPAQHGDWEWIAARIDAAVAAIGAGAEDEAFGIYVAMVRRLEARWLAGRGTAGAGTKGAGTEGAGAAGAGAAS